MSGLQKPFANEKKPEAAAPAKKGGFFGKLLKLIVLAIVLGLVGSMVWTGKRMGEDAAIRAKTGAVTDEDARANAKIVWPWQWSTAQWESWANQTKATVTQAGQTAATTITEKAKQAKAELDAYIAKRKSAQPATTTTATTTTTHSPTTTPPETTATTTAPMSDSAAADLKKADDLIAQGGDLFNDKPADAQKKLEEAVALLEPYTRKTPVDPKMQEAYDRTTNTIDALKQRQY